MSISRCPSLINASFALMYILLFWDYACMYDMVVLDSTLYVVHLVTPPCYFVPDQTHYGWNQDEA